MDQLTGEQPRLHPALNTSYSLSSDVFPGLFDWIFANDVFKYWVNGTTTRQLYFIGEPGSGKTVLAKLASLKLRKEIHSSDHFVACIFINNDIADESVSHHELLADFLQTVLYQFGNSDSSITDQVRFAEGGVSARLEFLRDALSGQLLQCERAFLIVDGLDRCGSALRSLLRNELLQLRDQRLSVMITSRLPVFFEGTVQEPDVARCDHEQNHEHLVDLLVFLECQACHFTMCFPCRGKGEVCSNCHNTLLLTEPQEEYNTHISFSIGKIPVESMNQFIHWDLEREHGDLGLGSCHPRKPPLSDFGIKLLDYPPIRLVELLGKSNINGNIAMAKARLDSIHKTTSVADLHTSHDRIPPNIVSLFDAEITCIEAKSGPMRDFALKSIALLCDSPEGMFVHEFEKQLARIAPTRDNGPRLNLENVMEASRGLFTVVPYENGLYELKPYTHSFYLYVHDNYSESLYWAKVEMRRFKPPPRSTTINIKTMKALHFSRTVTDNFSNPKSSAAHWSLR